MDDPVTMLKNDHAVLLGQLALLEKRVEQEEDTIALLHALIRDCTVHFRREQVLFDALQPALGSGGQSLDSLATEHRELESKVKDLLEVVRGTRRDGMRYREYVHELVGQFQTHIRHEETVVFVLVGTRLAIEQRRDIAQKMLAV